MAYAHAVKRGAACCLGLLLVWIGLFMKNLASEILQNQIFQSWQRA
jgi:hypothetical protein